MHLFHVRPAGLMVVLLLLAGGCAKRHPVLEAYLNDSDITSTLELLDTPFFPQEDYQCGPAALATVLVASDVSVTPDELTSKVYLPKREGSLQLELIATSRRYGRLPYVLDGKLTAILAAMQNWMEEKEYESIAQLKGSMSQKNLPDPSIVARASYLRVLDSFSPRPGVWS